MNPKNIFEQNGYLHIKDILSKDLCIFLTHALFRSSSYTQQFGDDNQVKELKAFLSHEYMFETLHENIWNKLENIIEEELIPTYSYARIYSNGSILEKHTDRPSCEISVTLQLSRTHHYAWPIYMGNQRIDLGEGEAVVYKGCDLEHFRNICDGPKDYLSGQVFMHFVKANGKYGKEYGGDKRWEKEIPFIRNNHLIWQK